MNLISNFNLDPFLRTVWVSQEAQDMWEQSLNACNQLVQELEIESVINDQRKCAWRTVSLKSLLEFIMECNDKGLTILPVSLVASWGNGFAHKTQSPKPDDPNPNVYCIISKSLEYAIEFRDAHLKGDHIKQGEMLGFPKCCTEFFDKNWKAGFFDPMWQIASEELFVGTNNNVNSYEAVHIPKGEDLRKGHNMNAVWNDDDGKIIYVLKSHPFSVPILRYIGLRVGFHIPCSFNCEETIDQAKARLFMSKDQEMVKVLRAFLSMPIAWECYHGISIIKTPIFYVITSSMPTTEKFKIHIFGKFIPREAKKGIEFPFYLRREK